MVWFRGRDCGCDAQPWFREKFDPDGLYVRQCAPELRFIEIARKHLG